VSEHLSCASAPQCYCCSCDVALAHREKLREAQLQANAEAQLRALLSEARSEAEQLRLQLERSRVEEQKAREGWLAASAAWGRELRRADALSFELEAQRRTINLNPTPKNQLDNPR
jgi:hypothetical protein